MIEQLQLSAGHLVSRYHFRKTTDRVVSFSGTLSASKSVMVVLPFGDNDPQSFRSITDLLIERFDGQYITVISSDHAVDMMRLLPRSTIIHYRTDELNMFRLPRKELHERIVSRSIDLAIDLNLDFLLPPAYICKASGAAIRVGFQRKYAEHYFNFLVRPDLTLARKLIYGRLAHFLRRF
jgi:hypothetical protein